MSKILEDDIGAAFGKDNGKTYTKYWYKDTWRNRLLHPIKRVRGIILTRKVKKMMRVALERRNNNE